MPLSVELIQVATFLSDRINLPQFKTQIANEIITVIPGLDNVEPAIIPLPPDIPAEVPGVIFQNPNPGWSFQYAPARCDFVFKPIQPSDITQLREIIEQQITPVVTKSWELLSKKLHLHSNRLGFVVICSMPTSKSAEHILTAYIKPELSLAAAQIQLGFMSREPFNDIQLNHWLRIQTRIDEENFSESLVMVIDINSPAEYLTEVDSNTLSEFLKSAQKLAEEDISKHGTI